MKENVTRKNVTYMLKCPCGLAYTGKTTRALKTRIIEHRFAIWNQDITCPFKKKTNTAYPVSDTLAVKPLNALTEEVTLTLYSSEEKCFGFIHWILSHQGLCLVWMKTLISDHSCDCLFIYCCHVLFRQELIIVLFINMCIISCMTWLSPILVFIFG